MPKQNYLVRLTGERQSREWAYKKFGGTYFTNGQRYFTRENDARKLILKLAARGIPCELTDCRGLDGPELKVVTEDEQDAINKRNADDAKLCLRMALSTHLEEYMNEAEHQDGYGYWSEHFRKPDGSWDVEGMMKDFWMILGYDLGIAFDVQEEEEIEPGETTPLAKMELPPIKPTQRDNGVPERDFSGFFAVGKTDGSLGPYYFSEKQGAIDWLSDRAQHDPEGYSAGHYYISEPEENKST
jgi:hypothetical protein